MQPPALAGRERPRSQPCYHRLPGARPADVWLKPRVPRKAAQLHRLLQQERPPPLGGPKGGNQDPWVRVMGRKQAGELAPRGDGQGGQGWRAILKAPRAREGSQCRVRGSVGKSRGPENITAAGKVGQERSQSARAKAKQVVIHCTTKHVSQFVGDPRNVVNLQGQAVRVGKADDTAE